MQQTFTGPDLTFAARIKLNSRFKLFARLDRISCVLEKLASGNGRQANHYFA
jgi:hypothetical protein